MRAPGWLRRCACRSAKTTPPPLVETAPWGYVRLRLENYSDADLAFVGQPTCSDAMGGAMCTYARTDGTGLRGGAVAAGSR